MRLVDGDRIHTGFKAGVTLNFPDGSRLHGGPMTILHLTDIAVGPEGGVQARLLFKTGEVKLQVNRSTGARGTSRSRRPPRRPACAEPSSRSPTTGRRRPSRCRRGLSSARALARVTGKPARGLTRCTFGVVSNRLAPITGGWSATFVIVEVKQGIKGKPKGTTQFQLKGKSLSARNALARKITQGCH